MTQLSHPLPAELERALYRFATAPNGLSAHALDELARHYPEFAVDLTEIAVELALEAMAEGEVPAIEEATSPAVSRAMSNFNNRLHEVNALWQSLETKSAEGRNLFGSLNREAMTALAVRLGATRLFIIKLRDRVIDPKTITAGFRAFLAECTNWSLPEINLHFRGTPATAQGIRYKSDQKPTTQPQQSFDEAVRSSNLTEEQQARLLRL